LLKVVLFLVLLFLILLGLRALRLALASWLGPACRRRSGPAQVEGEMVRDPVCGVWVDRRLALAAGSGSQAVSVCSEACRRAAERGERKIAP
jgi:hypothetical protein